MHAITVFVSGDKSLRFVNFRHTVRERVNLQGKKFYHFHFSSLFNGDLLLKQRLDCLLMDNWMNRGGLISLN